ncbi:lipopolysaccharide biosynthesis protein [Kaistella faecalis]|uniref:lipopolysaccharide biosynthesis protein n=1 Tax=Kaistella faecalis TaxID=2852098 RepID=UPI001C46E162|nr:lipopolysaccharide biosynthesis protein [Chryseobacterium faecale]UFK97090.1 lipopolysaccharide biosynthesis protein [Chryseobacterium faecale]
MSLKKQAVSSMIWTFSQQFGSQLITFAVSVILARLLLPSDFGTIAMFTVVMSIASALVDGGMSSSLIRSTNVDDRDLSTVFWFNFGVAVAMYIIIFFTAPLIADFYKVEILTPVIRVYSLSIIIGSLTAVQGTRFTKAMDFKTLFKIQLPSLIIGALAAVVMAYNGFGIWTLVFYPLIQSVVGGIQLWFYSRWKPLLVFDRAKFKEHFGFGYKMTLSGLLDTVFKNIYTILIGKYFSSADLGYYNRADNLKQLPVNNLSSALNKVTFPLFSKIKDNNVKLKEVYQKLMKLVIFVIAPVLFLMMVVAEPMIRFLLTEKWLPAIPYLQVLVLSGILYPIHAYNLNILKVKGRSDLFLKLEFWKKGLQLITLLTSVPYGIIGIVWGQVVFSVLAFFINTHYTGKMLKYGSMHQILDLMPIISLSAGVALIIYVSDHFFFYNWVDLPRLLVLTFLYAGLYLVGVWIFKFKEINYLKDLLKK